MNIKCDYGCNQLANYQMTSGKWCCEKIYNKCPEVRRKNSEKNKIRMTGVCGKNHPHYGFKDSENTKKIKSIQKLGNKNPMKRQEVSKKNSLSNIGKTMSEKTKIKMSECRLGEKNHFYNKKHSEESKEKIRKKCKELYKNIDFLNKYSNSLSIKPNKPELILIELLNNILPGEYEYVGNFKIWICGKNPDFINKSKNKIIEFFGEYWHPKEDENIRINHFKKEGYETLIIWESEMCDLNSLKNKIIYFNKGLENEE